MAFRQWSRNEPWQEKLETRVFVVPAALWSVIAVAGWSRSEWQSRRLRSTGYVIAPFATDLGATPNPTSPYSLIQLRINPCRLSPLSFVHRCWQLPHPP